MPGAVAGLGIGEGWLSESVPKSSLLAVVTMALR